MSDSLVPGVHFPFLALALALTSLTASLTTISTTPAILTSSSASSILTSTVRNRRHLLGEGRVEGLVQHRRTRKTHCT